MSVASIAIVPLPHIGLTSALFLSQPVAMRTPRGKRFLHWAHEAVSCGSRVATRVLLTCRGTTCRGCPAIRRKTTVRFCSGPGCRTRTLDCAYLVHNRILAPQAGEPRVEDCLREDGRRHAHITAGVHHLVPRIPAQSAVELVRMRRLELGKQIQNPVRGAEAGGLSVMVSFSDPRGSTAASSSRTTGKPSWWGLCGQKRRHGLGAGYDQCAFL